MVCNSVILATERRKSGRLQVHGKSRLYDKNLFQNNSKKGKKVGNERRKKALTEGAMNRKYEYSL